MRTPAFCKTFMKSFCAGLLRVFAQTPLTRGVGQTAPQTGGYTYLGLKKKTGARGQTALVTRRLPLFRGNKKTFFSNKKRDFFEKSLFSLKSQVISDKILITLSLYNNLGISF